MPKQLFSSRKFFLATLLLAFCSQFLASDVPVERLLATSYSDIASVFGGFSADPSSTSTELNADVTLVTGSADAIVYCGAFASASATKNKPASNSDIYKQGFYAYSSKRLASVRMTGLTPATLYNIYCMTVSVTDASQMPFSVTLTHNTLGLTNCCKVATFTSTISSLYTLASTVSNTKALYMSLSAAPSTNVTFSLTLASTTGNTVGNLGSLSKTSLTFSSTYTPNTPVPVVLVGGVPDTYSITAAMVSGAVQEYNLVTAGSTTITVLSTTAEPNAPVLSSAVFSSDGTYVTVSFDSPTNQGGYANSFSCGALLSFDGSSTATCSWIDSSHITIYPAYSDSVAVLGLNSKISVNFKTIMAFCTDTAAACAKWTHYTDSSTQVSVTASASAVAPTVVVSGPASVGRCSPIVLDWSNSVGNAGRPWSSVTFTVSDPVSNPNITLVSNFLASSAYTVSPPAAIPQAYLVAGHTYTFTGVFTNFLGASGTASKAVAVSSVSATPIVSIAGLNTITQYTWNTLLVNAAAYTQNCDGSVSVADLTYTWTLYQTGVTDTVVAVTSASQNPAAFKLAPYTLTVGNTYRVQVSVKTSTSDSVTASVMVVVNPSNLVAVISGGSSRSLQVGATTYTIDASSSYDQDKQSLTGLAAGLTYTWTCWQTSPSYSATCPVTLTQGTTAAQRVVSTAGGVVGNVARVTVTVSDATRTTSTYMDIKLTLQPSSVITVGSSLSSLTSVNVNQQITLTGSLSLVSACTATWSVDDSSLNLGNIALTPISTGFTTLQPATNTMALLIPGGSLPQRATLGFTLSCGSVSSTFSFTTNGSPLPGLFTASPTSGVELTQTFTFTASRWTDPDLPLSYQFGFISPSTGALLTFRGKAAASYAGTKLPAGASTANNAVYTTLLVYDVYGAASSVEGNVTVTAAASASAQAAGITSLIAASSGSVDDTNSVIATVGVVLNNVDCSGTPNCASLHRQECSTVAHTCGICQAGYLGVANSDNSACMTLDEYKNTQTRRLTVGATCTSNAGCNAGNWETCVSGKCVQASKTCPNSCNSKGTCSYSLISTGEALDSCGLSDVTCQALCECDAGYAGSSCSFTSEDMATRQALRAQLIQSLENVTKIDDINEQSIISWANSLSSLALNADELTVAEAAIVRNIVTLTIENAASLGTTDYNSLLGLLTSLDSAGTVYVTEDRRRRLSGEDRRLTTAGAMDVLKTAGSFADVIANGMGLDQPPTVNILGNFRMTTQITTSSAGDTIDVQGPQSDLEYYSNSNTPYISMTAGSSGNAVKNSMVLANANTYASILSSLNSNPMQIRIGSGSGLTKFVYMTYNNVPNPLLMDSYVNPVFVLRCNTLKHTETFTCPDGTVLTQQCIGYAGNYSLACPAPAPQCSVLDTTTLGLSKGTGCKVIDKPYSPYYTTCECTLNPSGNRRLSVQDVLGETGITNMVTTSTYIATQFTSTFSASKDFTTPGDAQKVLIVILMFAILWASGGLAFCVLFMARWKRIQKTNIERRRSTKAGSATHTTADIKRYLLNYVDKLIPDVYHSAKGKMERAMEETRKHHRYLQLFTAKDDQIDVNKRIITLTKMLTIQTMLMFLLAVLYDLQGPDNDGTCVNHDSKSACLQRKSILDSTQTYCQWKVDPKVGWDTCTYNPPNFTVKIMIYIIILTSIFTSICNTPIDMLFDMLEAPTEQTVGVSRLVKATQAVAAGARRASVAGMQIAKAAVANVKQLTWYQKVTGRKEGEEEVLAHRRIPDDVHFAHTMAYMALPEITAQAQVSHLQQTVASNEVRAVAAKRMTQIRGSDRKSGKEETRGAEAVAVAEPLKKDIDRSMDQLLEEIMQQRLILPAESEETTEFDKQWGIEKSISTDARTVSTSLFVNSESLKGISKDVTGSEEKSKDLKKKMENFSDNQAGLDILHFFMVDLLGRHTLAAKIFENKFEEDFERTDVVSKPMKWLVVAAIFGINAFFMYYSLLKGFSKGIHWQNQYLIGCISQLFIEIFLFESLECVWINYWVPDLVSSEVMRAGTVLKAAAEKISLADKNDHRENPEASKYFLDAPSYLFVSTKLAKAFPKLLESIIVSSYRNHLPGEIARTWRNERSQGKGYKVETELAIKKTFGGSMMGTFVFSCILSLTTVVVVCLQALGSLPYFYQRIIIRFVQPVLLSGLTLLWYFAVHNPIYFAIIGSIVAILGMVLYYRYRNRVVNAKLAKVQPAASSSSRRSDKVRDMGEAKVNEMVPVASLNGPIGGGSNKAGSVPSSEEGVAAVTPSNAMKRILANVMEESSSEDSMSI